jgi:uncharacterized membrane protein YdjX (TVP38/TMEM64 family)
MMKPSRIFSKRAAGRLVLALLLLVVIAIAVRFLPLQTWVRTLQEESKARGFVGLLLYAVVYAAACVLLMPASLLTLGAGAIFGVAKGTAVVVAGATAGAFASYLIARTIARRRVSEIAAKSEKFQRLDSAIARNSLKFLLLIRLSPIFPFTWVNYLFGVTAIRPLPYLLGTIVGILPATFAYVYLGSAGAAALVGHQPLQRVLAIGGAVVALVVSIVIARIAAREVRRSGIVED